MRLRDGPVVEPQHRFDHARERGRHVNRPGASTIGAAIILELLQFDAEGRFELRNRPGEHHGAATFVALDDSQAVVAGEILHGAQVSLVCAEPGRELGVRQGLPGLPVPLENAAKPLPAFLRRTTTLTSSRSSASVRTTARATRNGVRSLPASGVLSMGGAFHRRAALTAHGRWVPRPSNARATRLSCGVGLREPLGCRLSGRGGNGRFRPIAGAPRTLRSARAS